MKKNKRELPSSAKPKQKLHRSLFFVHESGCLLTIYQDRPEKNVCILSTLHEKPKISPKKAQLNLKPNTILDYDSSSCCIKI